MLVGDTKNHFLAIRRITGEAGIENAVIRQLLQPSAIAAHAHQLGPALAPLE